MNFVATTFHVIPFFYHALFYVTPLERLGRHSHAGEAVKELPKSAFFAL